MGNVCHKDVESASKPCETFTTEIKSSEADALKSQELDQTAGSRRPSKVTFRIEERFDWQDVWKFFPFQRERDVITKPYPVDFDTVEKVRNALFLPLFKYKRNKENIWLSKTVLAKGKFGKVVRGQIGKTSVAVKVISKRKVLQENLISQIAQEVKIQTMTGHHSFILELVRCWQTEKSLYIATVFSQGGNLEDLWKSRSSFPLASVRLGIAQLGLGVAFLHQAGVIYRDLKMANVLLDSVGNLQIADFGLSKWLSLGQTANTICGTLAFMAPEVLCGCSYSHASDWYSLGVLTFCLLKMEYPVPPAADHNQMLSRIKSTSIDWSDQPQDVLTSRLMENHPANRISTLTQFKQADFFNEISFDVVNAKMGKSFIQLLDQDLEEKPRLNDQWADF